MAFQKVTDTVEVTIVYEQNLENIVNVFHAERPGGYTQANLATLATTVDAAVGVHLLPEMTSDCEYLRTEVRGLAVENDFFAEESGGTGPGEVASAGLPNSVTLSLKKGSGLTGRSARGRWYFVGIPEIDLATNENFFIAVEVTNKKSALNNLRAAVAGTAWNPVIVSRFKDGALRPEGVLFDWLAVTAVNDAVDTQRRRLSN